MSRYAQQGAFTSLGRPQSKSYVTPNDIFPMVGPEAVQLQTFAETPQRYQSWSAQLANMGKVVYLESTVESFLRQVYNEFVTRDFLPLHEYLDTNFAVENHDTDRTLVEAVPPEGVPSYVTHGKSRQDFTMRRYAKATTIGLEELRSEEGEFIFNKNLFNVALAFADTMNTEAIQEILDAPLRHPSQKREALDKYNSISDVFAYEIDTFGIIQKTERGFWMLKEEVKKAIAPYVPTKAVVPMGARSLIAHDPAELEDYRAGTESRALLKRGADAVGLSVPGDPMIDINVCAEWNLGGDGARVAPLRRIVSIGDHLRISARDACKDDGTVTQVFTLDVARGDFVPLQYDHLLEFIERFEPDGTLKQAHYDLAANVEGAMAATGLSGKHFRNGVVDMYLYRMSDGVSYGVTEMIGHMERGALSDQAWHSAARSLASRMRDQLGDKHWQAITDALNYIEQTYSVQSPPAGPVVFSSNNPIIANGIYRPNEFGGPNVSVDTIKNLKEYPLGYGSVPGFRTLSKAYDGSQPQGSGVYMAAAFNRALDALLDILLSCFDKTHPALNPANVPAYFKSSLHGSAGEREDMKTVLAQNILDQNKVPLHYTGVAGELRPDGVQINVVEGVQYAGSDEKSENIQASAKLMIETIREYARPTTAALFNVEQSGTVEQKRMNLQAKIDEFAKKYRESSFAKAFKRGTSAQKCSLGEFFATLTTIATDGTGNIPPANLSLGLAVAVQKMIEHVSSGKTIPIESISETVQAWIRSDYSANADSVNDRIARGAITQLVLPLSVSPPNGFKHASPFDVTTVLNADNYAQSVEDSRRNPAGAFIGSQSHMGYGGGGAMQTSRHTESAYEAFGLQHQRLAGGAHSKKRSYAESFEPEHVPSFAGSAFTEVSGGHLEINDNLTSRYHEAAMHYHNALERAAAQLILLAPVHKNTFARTRACGVTGLLDILGERFNARFQTSGVIFAEPGDGALGQLAYALLDTTMGANSITKTFDVHVSMWWKAIIIRPERVFVVPDAVLNQYMGGMGVLPIRADNFNIAAYLPGSQSAEAAGSVMYFAEPAGSLRGADAVPLSHDIRGAFNESLTAGRVKAHVIEQEKRLHHASALYYNLLYQLTDMQPLQDPGNEMYHDRTSHHNTITHQGAQYMFDRKTGKFSHFVPNTGHLGNVYKGMGNVLVDERVAHFKQIDVHSNYVPLD